MRTWFLRGLVLSCSLALALPPGWCCLVPARATQDTPVPAGHCCSYTKSAPPADPVPEPAPAKPGGCGCCERDSTPPLDPERLIAAPAPAASPAVEPSPPRAGPGLTFAVGFHAPSPPLQILYCVWLC